MQCGVSENLTIPVNPDEWHGESGVVRKRSERLSSACDCIGIGVGGSAAAAMSVAVAIIAMALPPMRCHC
jgi:hypothetical protein